MKCNRKHVGVHLGLQHKNVLRYVSPDGGTPSSLEAGTARGLLRLLPVVQHPRSMLGGWRACRRNTRILENLLVQFNNLADLGTYDIYE